MQSRRLRLSTPASAALPLDERLRLDHGVLAGEGVEGREEEATGAGLDGHEAERRHGKTMMTGKVVQQSALAAVGEDLLVDVQEEVRRQHFDLETGLVEDAVSTGERGA